MSEFPPPQETPFNAKEIYKQLGETIDEDNERLRDVPRDVNIEALQKQALDATDALTRERGIDSIEKFIAAAKFKVTSRSMSKGAYNMIMKQLRQMYPSVE